jgi:LuxR family maltose regulon positive regulatory protein
MDAAVRSGLMRIIATGCLLNDDLPGGARACTEAVELARSSGNIMLEVAARTLLGDLNELTGRLCEAEAIYQEALQRAVLHNSPVAAQAYLCLARVCREWNDLASARLFAEKAIECSGTWGHLDALAAGYLLLATVLQAQRDFPEANRALAEGSRVIREHPLEIRSMPWIGAKRARLWLVQGKLEDARRWAETRRLSEVGRINLRNEVEYLSLVRILLAEGRADEAMRLLSRLQSAMESAGRQGSLVEVLVLQAVAFDMQAEAGSALAVLERAVSLAHSEGYMRMFLDEGKPIETLLKAAITRWRDHDLLAHVRRLLAAIADEGVPTAPGEVPCAGILSERELEVLRLMAAGCSNQEIADQLVIAIGTAKRHIANIFNKLDVRNRTEAVTKARQLGLL